MTQPSLLEATAFARHMDAANRARSAGACHPCCWEAGMRATDGEMPRERVGEMHAECAKRIARGAHVATLTSR